MALHDSILIQCRERASHPAVVEPSGSHLCYGELDHLSAGVRGILMNQGIGRGDRVGIYMRKSADTVVALLGVLRSGAGYVPVDPAAPASRSAYIFSNCGVKTVIVEERFASALRNELTVLTADPELLVVQDLGGGAGVRNLLAAHAGSNPDQKSADALVVPEDLAYVLYTSGSTGKPKGVTLTHEAACAFVDWCSETFDPKASDRFSAHAPFHFDLSIFDIYVSLKHGGTLYVIDEDLGKEPTRLARYIAESRLTIWYSAPFILGLMAQQGRLHEHDFSALHTVLFAGEVFPIVHLRSLKQQWPGPRFFNLYGPTETNVCTFYEIPGTIPPDRAEPYPIGRVCSHLRGMIVDEEGRRLGERDEGELCIAGPAVMSGYWERADLAARAFLVDAEGTPWYRTGDIVSLDESDDYRYLGRRDRMVKKRGYRVELGEIEACLYQVDKVKEAAVVGLPDEELGLCVVAHLGTAGGERLSLIALKQFCSRHLPVYMIPDRFAFHESLPKTSTGKMDYQRLKELGK